MHSELFAQSNSGAQVFFIFPSSGSIHHRKLSKVLHVSITPFLAW